MFDAKFLSALPKSDENAYKYSRGKVSIFAGSKEYPGAAIMAAEACARAGAGYVTLFVPEDIVQICQREQPAIVTREINLAQEIPAQDCYLTGPGRGGANPKENEELVDILLKTDAPLVVDADLIQFVKPESLTKRQTPVIITPHAGELSRWLGSNFDIDLKTASKDQIVSAVQAKIEDANMIVVAKGHHTFVISKDECLEPTPGTESLATAGTGDVLAGTIAGLIAQNHGEKTLETCAAAVEVHALAGILAAGDYGSRGVIATDVIQKLGVAIDELKK